MSKINVLSFEIANLIAAGEVVERPASVLKELLENSIDSGATKIICEIKRGGVALIRVSDNGAGIDKDDLPIAIKRHATSKIKNKDDLESILTLGFRGEALAAISSVSEMTIISKTKESASAYMLTAEGGNIVDVSEVGASDGTTVVVENLFYNVPARRKFLKKDSTEAMNVSALVEKIALSRPDISIQLLVDGEEKFKTPGDSNLHNTIYSIFGKDFSEKLIKCEGTANGVRVSGFIGRSDNVKKNRNLMNVFINSRYVKSLTAMAAIEKAFTSYIAPECFPACVLFLEMNPALVDVNVHPAKLEVKFSDERAVFEAVYYTVKEALLGFEYRPEISLKEKNKTERNFFGAFVPIGESTKGEQLSLKNSFNSNLSTEAKAYKADADKTFSFNTSFGKTSHQEKHEAAPKIDVSPKASIDLLKRFSEAKETPAEEYKEAFKAPVPDVVPKTYKYLGEVFNCYLLVEYEGELLIIDKHAAHERILFEKIKKTREMDGRVATQTLLLPVSISLGKDELAAARDFKNDFSEVGFDYAINGGMVDLYEIPEAISVKDAETLFVNMLTDLIEGKGNPQFTEAVRRERSLYQIACKAAIKGGRVYDTALISWLIEKVISLPDITVCPHGRPIAYKMKKSELDRQFERIK